MKLFLKSALLLMLGLLLESGTAQAQMRVNVNMQNPYWGPAVGPDVEYYYIPEIDGYYDLYSERYLYQENGYWVSSPVLPSYYSSYDPRYFHPVVIEYVGRQPWGYIRDHRAYCGRMGVVPGRYYNYRRSYGPSYGYGYRQPARAYSYGGRGYGHNDHDRDGYYRNNRRDDDERNDRRYENERGGQRGGYEQRGRGYEQRGSDDEHEQRGGNGRASEDNQGHGNGRNGRGRF